MNSQVLFVISILLLKIFPINLLARNAYLDDFDKNSSSLPIFWVREYIPEKYINPSIDYIQATAIDNNGYIYAAGHSRLYNGTDDIITIKFNPSGVIEWIVRFDGIGKSTDQARGITVDSEGNVYVCGVSQTSKNNSDFVLIKYTSLGNKEWDVYFNGPNNDYDEPRVIKLDQFGNIYITGLSYSILNSYNWVTVKYNSSGSIQWAVIYDGYANSIDYPVALEIDEAGNVIVSGFSTELNSGFDFTIIKYNPNGKVIWISHYNGYYNGNDFAECMALDNFGNIYLSGMSEVAAGKYNIVTIMLNKYGNLIWSRTFDNPSSSNDGAVGIIVDSSGDIIVTGRSFGGDELYDIITIKYNMAGERLWISRFDGNGLNDEPTSIAVDNLNNIYITGISISTTTSIDIVTIKYAPDGAKQWVNIFDGIDNDMDMPSGILVDKSGNIYIGGSSNNKVTFSDILLLKYTNSGTLEWQIIQDIFGGGIAFVSDFVIDKSGNVYVVGKSYDARKKFFDYIIIKYNELGEILWISKFDATNDTSIFKISIALDSLQNIYVAGVIYSNETSFDYLIIKVLQNGNIDWLRRYNSDDNKDDIPTDISTDRYGNIYITGYSDSKLHSSDYLTIKYNSNGELIWIKRYNGLADNDDFPISLLVDHTSNVSVIGKSKGVDNSYDIVIVRYNSNGELAWISRYSGLSQVDDIPVAATLDKLGYLYVTGITQGSLTGKDYLTIKYSFNGTALWVRSYNGTANSDDFPADITTDEFGNVYVTGKSFGAGSAFDFLTIKYSSAGLEQWVCRYNNFSNQVDEAKSILVDDKGNVYVNGVSSQGNYFISVMVVYNKFGYIISETEYKESYSTKLEPIKMMMDSFNDLVMCTNVQSFESMKFTTIKFKNIITNITQTSSTDTTFIAIYPNPFNEKVTIIFNLPDFEEVELDIFDINGRIIKSFYDELQKTKLHKIIWDGTNNNLQKVSSGTYFIRIKAGKVIQSKKILFVK